jgi:hypothetical protein
VKAKALATRYQLPRHLEPVLQAWCATASSRASAGRASDGYGLARERRRITADEILRAAGTVDVIESKPNDGRGR